MAYDLKLCRLFKIHRIWMPIWQVAPPVTPYVPASTHLPAQSPLEKARLVTVKRWISLFFFLPSRCRAHSFSFVPWGDGEGADQFRFPTLRRGPGGLAPLTPLRAPALGAGVPTTPLRSVKKQMPRRVEGGPGHQHHRNLADHRPRYTLGQGLEQPAQHDTGGQHHRREAGVRGHPKCGGHGTQRAM
jgi:hypothetical protein